MIEIFTTRNNGAITVFLSLILVPVLAFTGVFIDWGRAYLAQSVAASSADLALNTILTSYDKELNEYYGLIASCQNTKDFMNISEEYFKNCLNSEVIDPDYLDTLWDELVISLKNIENASTGSTEKTDALTADDVANFLLMDTNNSTVEISKAYGADKGNSDLSNPVFLKSQIVEFMKYRAPIGLAESIFEEIGENMDSDQLNQAGNDKKLQKKEEKAYREEMKFMKKLKKTYTAMKAYNAKGISEEVLKSIINVENYRNQYAEIHKRMIKNYAGIDTSVSRYPQEGFKYQYSLNEFQEPLRYGNQKYGNTSGKSLASADNIEDINYIKETIEKSIKQITVFKNAKSTLETKITSALDITGIAPSSINNSVYAVRLISQIYSTDLANAITQYNQQIVDLMNCYIKLINIKDYGSDALESIDVLLTINNVWNNDNSGYAPDYLGTEKKYKEHLEKAVEMINNIFNEYIEISAWNTPTPEMTIIKLISDNALDNEEVNYKLVIQRDEDSKKLAEIADEIEKNIDNLKVAIDQLGEVETCLTDLDNIYKKYNDKYDDWKTFALSTINSSAYCEVSKKSLDEDELQQSGITTKNLKKFKTRIINTKKLLKEVKEKLEEDIKYGNKKISKIKNINGMISATTAEQDVKGKFTESDLNALSDSIWNNTYIADLEMPNICKDNNENNNNPEYSMEDSAYENPVYKFMMNKFKDTEESNDTSEFDKKDKKQEDAKSKLEKIEDDTSIPDIKTELEEWKDSYPSKLVTEENGVDLLSGLLGLVGNFSEKEFEATIEQYRDALYVADYCMEMFSYMTYEKETKYEYMIAENQKNSSKFTGIHDLNCTIPFKNILDLKYSANTGELNALVNNEDVTKTYNKSLTNKMINSTNNYAYTRELEYILFGKTNKENVSEMGTELFELRYALNLGPGIAKFWSNSVLMNISSTISAATGGLVPELLIRMVLILLIIGMESLNDVNLLMEGIPVQFFKAGDDAEWVYDIKDGINFDNLDGYASTGTHKADENVFRLSYSHYMMLMLFFQLNDEEKNNDVYKRIGDVIQANMSQKIIRKNDYALSNAITQYKIDYTLTVKPLVLNLGIYNGYSDNPSSLTEWRTFSGSMVRGY